MLFTTSVCTAGLGMVHPLLASLMAYDWYMLFRGLQIMNQTCESLYLHKGKRHVMATKLNFLGYEKAPQGRRISLRNIRYLGLYENTFMTTHHRGLPPSFQKLFRTEKDTMAEDAERKDQDVDSDAPIG